MLLTSDIIEVALSKTAKSLADNIPYDIDECTDDGRFIVEFSFYCDEITLLKAEILDSDWELDIPKTEEFTTKVRNMVETWNYEFTQSIRQAIDIQKDRTEML